jgi:hypothetical protein
MFLPQSEGGGSNYAWDCRMIHRHASQLPFSCNTYGGDGVRKFNKWKGGTGASGGELDEIITYFQKKGRPILRNVEFCASGVAAAELSP